MGKWLFQWYIFLGKIQQTCVPSANSSSHPSNELVKRNLSLCGLSLIVLIFFGNLHEARASSDFNAPANSGTPDAAKIFTENDPCTGSFSTIDSTITVSPSAQTNLQHLQILLQDAEAKTRHGLIRQALKNLIHAHHILNKQKENKNSPEISRAEALIHGRIGNACMAIGHFDSAEKHLQHALDIADTADTSLTATLYNDLGNLFVAQSNTLDTTLTVRKKKVEILKKGGRLTEEEFKKEYSNLIKQQDEINNLFGGAMGHYSQALSKITDNTSHSLFTGQIYLNMARAFILQGKYRPARKHLGLAIEKITKLNDSTDKAHGLISLGALNSLLGQTRLEFRDSSFSTSDKFLRAALDLTHKIEKDIKESLAAKTISTKLANTQTREVRHIRSYALGHLGALASKTGKPTEALKQTNQALLLAQETQQPPILFKWGWQKARLLKTMGKTQEALTAYDQATSLLAKLPRFTPVGFKGRKESLRDRLGQFYLEQAEIHLQQVGKTEFDLPDRKENAQKDPELIALIRARETMETFKTAEIQDYYQNDCVEAYKDKMTVIDTLVQEAPLEKTPDPTAVILYPIILPHRLELIVSLHDGYRRYTPKEAGKEISEEQLFEQAILYRHSLQDHDSDFKDYKKYGLQLYKWLITPIKPSLEGRKTLVIVPDGILRTIPFAALYNPEFHSGEEKEKEFLIQEYALASTSTLQIPDPKPTPREDLRFLSLGLTPQSSPETPDQGFSSIESQSKADVARGARDLDTKRELTELKKIFDDAEIVKDKRFTLAVVDTTMNENPFSIVHISTHGEFKESIHDSFLETADPGGQISMNQLGQMVGYFKYRDKPLELLTLSACQTAEGSEQAALGLTGVALNAGAKSVLATLWRVSAKASEKLTLQFYKNLLGRKNPNISKAKALQNAQKTILGLGKYKHPYYWSSFILFNNWM